jgi:MerR family transcriptional regulator/heat shock protein HspR
MHEHSGGLYSISVVARLTGLHEQTIRQYERIGLLRPGRTPGGTRTFSEVDLARLRAIANLTHEMGVNLAGVEIIMRMREAQERMLSLVREVLGGLDDEARRRFEAFFRGDEPGLVPAGRGDLARTQPEAEPTRRRIEIEGKDQS